MKKVFLSALMLCVMSLSTVVWAQENEACKAQAPEHHGKRMEAMAQELNLTPEQQQQMKEAHEALKASTQSSRQDMKVAREAFKTRMNEILTPEQQAQMEAKKGQCDGMKDKKMRRNHKDMKHGKFTPKGDCPRMKCDKKAECAKDGECAKQGDCPRVKCDKEQAKCQDMKGECAKKAECTQKADCPKKGECPRMSEPAQK